MQDPKDNTILVVDDEPGLRKAIVYDFKRKGYKVLDAENGTRAFELIKTEKIDLVLTDVRMPDGDGIALLNNIRAVHPKLPIVMFITGFADITLEEAYDKGVDAVFSKPFDRKALFASVAHALMNMDERWGNRSSERMPTDLEITLSFPDFDSSVQAKVLNLGRGGIFVAMIDKIPAVDTKVFFNIKYKSGPIDGIEGDGIVRWARSQNSPDLPSGCGIEFSYLKDQSRSQIIKILNELKTKAFIPKS